MPRCSGTVAASLLEEAVRSEPVSGEEPPEFPVFQGKYREFEQFWFSGMARMLEFTNRMSSLEENSRPIGTGNDAVFTGS